MLPKHPHQIGISILLFFAFVLSACGTASTPAADSANSTPAVTMEPAGESITPAPIDTTEQPPVATQALQDYTNPDFGFSLSYPAGYELQNSFYHTILFLAPQGTPGHRERAFMTMELTFDPDAGWYANWMKEDNANLGIEISSSVIDIDGQQAYILGNLPGQDLNRQVFVVVRGILYHLTFMPDDPQAGENYQQMESLYTAIVNSLSFLPERREVPPLTSMVNMTHQLEWALEARSEENILSLLGDEFTLGYWLPDTPEGISYAQYGSNEAARLILDEHLSRTPSLALEERVDWADLVGSPDLFPSYFPGEVVTPVLVKGWGAQGAGEAVLIIGRRSDGSLYWRGVFVAQGSF